MARALCVAAILLAGLGMADPQDEPADEKSPPVLAEIAERAATITGVRARFTQLKHTKLLKKPLESSGTVEAKDGIVRWDTTTPRHTVTVVDRNTVQIYYPDHATLEVFELGGQFGWLTASPVPRLETLRELFTIRIGDRSPDEAAAGADVVALVLVPRDAELAQHLQRVRAVIDRNTAIVRSVEMTAPDGERTEILFRDVKINPGLREQDLKLTIPPGTRVVRPLQGGDVPAEERNP